MITFSNIFFQPHGILARSRANSALGAPIIYTDKIYNMLRNFPIVDRFVPKDTKYWINNKTRAEKPKK